ncbi:MAG: glycosyltransferase family 2 protein [Gemmataceae bacterium]
MPVLSVVIPIKDERDNLLRLHEELTTALAPQVGQTGASGLEDYEVLIVDDGSSDDSLAILEGIAQRDPRVKVIALRRNYGQTPALRAGIDASSGDVIATMDGDLQNDPADLPRLLALLQEGKLDAVFGLRANRQDGLFLRKIPSLMGNWLIRQVTGVEVKDMGCTIRVMRRDLAEALPLYGEMHRFIPVLARMHGARVTQVSVNHRPRIAGVTKYTLSRTFRVLLDLITVKFLHTYVTRPMHALGMPGLFAMGLGMLAFFATIWMKYCSPHPVFMTGNPLLLLSVGLELVGVQFLSMGLLGELLARTYFESQGKPAYAIRSTMNLPSLPSSYPRKVA